MKDGFTFGRLRLLEVARVLEDIADCNLDGQPCWCGNHSNGACFRESCMVLEEFVKDVREVYGTGK